MFFFICFTTFSFSPQFDSIKVAEAQNNEALLSGKKDLKELLKQKQTLEIRMQSVQAMVDVDTHILLAPPCFTLTKEQKKSQKA